MCVNLSILNLHRYRICRRFIAEAANGGGELRRLIHETPRVVALTLRVRKALVQTDVAVPLTLSSRGARWPRTCATLVGADDAAKGKNASNSLDKARAKSCQTAPKRIVSRPLRVISGHFPAFSSKTRSRRVDYPSAWVGSSTAIDGRRHYAASSSQLSSARFGTCSKSTRLRVKSVAP